jgi:pheromone a factor receptor
LIFFIVIYLNGWDAEYVVSGERYVLFEDFGPTHCTIVTPPAFPLFFAWPVAIGTVSLVYCGKYLFLPMAFNPAAHFSTVMNIRNLYKRLRQSKDMVSPSSGFNQSLYIRLMALSSIELLGTVPLASFYIAFATELGIRKWSWAQIHSDYSHIEQIPNIVWKHDPKTALSLELIRWSVVMCAFLFFAFFGLAEDAWRHYSLIYTTLAHRVGYLPIRSYNSPHGYVIQRTSPE